MDIRILEGIAMPMALARMFLNAAHRYDLMQTVINYLKEVLIPYYQESLKPTCAEITRAETRTLGDSAFSAILEVCNSQFLLGVMQDKQKKYNKMDTRTSFMLRISLKSQLLERDPDEEQGNQ
ncbi:uncharacterized protein LOC134248323 [Saccostrea cucullata]|uniref:uncharacterized protein LOC134248323 n=1 Tax=Saccostrea cuccullata TaxID=36930 RepID=UPI002ED6918C